MAEEEIEAIRGLFDKTKVAKAHDMFDKFCDSISVIFRMDS